MHLLKEVGSLPDDSTVLSDTNMERHTKRDR